jgi:hypothetical protein
MLHGSGRYGRSGTAWIIPAFLRTPMIQAFDFAQFRTKSFSRSSRICAKLWRSGEILARKEAPSEAAQ